jgi:hypothetical protein
MTAATEPSRLALAGTQCNEVSMPVRQSSLASIVAILMIGSGCTHRAPLPAPPSAPAQLPALPGLSVLLTWSAPVDLDLYVTDPSAETVYFANTPTHSGARLLRDARCRDSHSALTASRVEIADLPEPRPGRYRVGVDFIDDCSSKTERANFRVAVDFGGTHREAIGMVQLAQFQPIVMEFEITRAKRDGSLVLSQEER